MIISNFTSSKGNTVANQFTIVSPLGTTFQSYRSIIAFIPNHTADDRRTVLDEYYWNYSKTTSKYLCLFLGLTTQEIKQGIKNGTFKLANLNP